MVAEELGDLRQSLWEWFKRLWKEAIKYQKGYVERGYREDGTWSYDMMEAPFKWFEWKRVYVALTSDPRSSVKMTTGVRTAFGITAITSDRQVGHLFINALWIEISSCNILPRRVEKVFFEKLYSQCAGYLVAERSLPYVATALIENLNCEELPLCLPPNNMLDRPSREESESLEANGGKWTAPGPPQMVFRHRFSLRITQGSGLVETPAEVIQAVQGAFSDLLRALAVAVPNRATIGVATITSDGWNPASVVWPLRGQRLVNLTTPTVIRAIDEDMVRSAWVRFRKKSSGRVWISAGRLATLYQRESVADSVVDVMVALEAVIGGDGERELAARISLYAARLTANTLGKTEREVYERILAGFERRRAVLRGRERSTPDVTVDREESLIKDIEDVVRVLLQNNVRGDARLKVPSLKLLLRQPNTRQD